MRILIETEINRLLLFGFIFTNKKKIHIFHFFFFNLNQLAKLKA